MKKIIGSEIDVYLKTSTSNFTSDLRGILVDVDEECIYIQASDNLENTFIVAKDNIRYCSTKDLHTAEITINTQSQITMPINEKIPEIPCLDVFINKEQVAHIPVPHTFDLSTWNENIIKIIAGNPDIQFYLTDKVQKSVEYYPGRLYIEVENKQPSQQSDNTFSMSMNGNVATQFLNPSQMVAKLNGMVKKEKINDQT